jgi:hypothetical protein
LKVVRRLAVSVALVGSAAVGLMAGPAAAVTTQPSAVRAVAPVSPPNSNLVGSGSHVRFDPSSLTVTDAKDGGCTPAHGEWTMTNTTSSKQVIHENGFHFALAPSEGAAFCGGGSPGTFVMKFTLKSNPHAKLKVTTIIP